MKKLMTVLLTVVLCLGLTGMAMAAETATQSLSATVLATELSIKEVSPTSINFRDVERGSSVNTEDLGTLIIITYSSPSEGSITVYASSPFTYGSLEVKSTADGSEVPDYTPIATSSESAQKVATTKATKNGGVKGIHFGYTAPTEAGGEVADTCIVTYTIQKG